MSSPEKPKKEIKAKRRESKSFWTRIQNHIKILYTFTHIVNAFGVC